MAVEESKNKTSPDRGWSPGLLRMTPVNAFQQVTELRGRDRHRTIGRRGPQEASSLEPLGEQARTLAVMPNDFQQIAPAAAEDEQVTAQRIAPQHLLDLQREAGKALAHIGVPGGEPHPHTARDLDHRDPSRV